MRGNAGTDGADRVTLIWANNQIQKQWLQVQVLASAATGLGAADVFYFGNAVGESGNNAANAQVDLADEIGARTNPHNFLDPAPLDDAYDYDRNQRVDLADEILARNNSTTFLNALRLINPAGGDAPFFLADSRASPPGAPQLELRREAGGLVLEITGNAPAGLRVEASPDLSAGSWQAVPVARLHAAGARRRLLTADGAPEQKFFRLVLSDAPGDVPAAPASPQPE